MSSLLAMTAKPLPTDDERAECYVKSVRKASNELEVEVANANPAPQSPPPEPDDPDPAYAK
jgi:hypothetical protein